MSIIGIYACWQVSETIRACMPQLLDTSELHSGGTLRLQYGADI